MNKRNLIFPIGLVLLITACTTSRRPVTASQSAQPKKKETSRVTFLDNVSVNQQGSRRNQINAPSANYEHPDNTTSYYPSSIIESYSPLRFKYAILLDVNVEEMTNGKLLAFIENWYGTPYHYGGTSMDGIDCSAFAASLLSSVYNVNNLPRISRDQFSSTRRIRRKDLQEGDLVFFHTSGRKKEVTHVGIYLCNNKFVHASVAGVMISDMYDGYYNKTFVGAGRVLEDVSKQ